MAMGGAAGGLKLPSVPAAGGSLPAASRSTARAGRQVSRFEDLGPRAGHLCGWAFPARSRLARPARGQLSVRIPPGGRPALRTALS